MDKKTQIVEDIFQEVISDWETNKQEDFLKVYPIFQMRNQLIELWVDIYEKTMTEYEKKAGEKKKSSSTIRRSISLNTDGIEKVYTRRKYIVNFLEKAVSKNYIKLTQNELTKIIQSIEKFSRDQEKIQLIKFYTNKRDYDLIDIPVLNFMTDEINTFDSVDPASIAKLITLEVSKIMNQVTTHELIEAALDHNYDEDKCPNLFKLKQKFKKYGNWPPTEILMNAIDKNQRIVMIKKFLNICIELKKLKNYYIYFAIIGGLDNIAIQRLDSLWKTEEEMKKTFTDLSSLVCPIHNFKNYRKEIGSIKTEPVLPFIGIITSTIKHALEVDFIRKKKDFNWKIYEHVLYEVKQFESYNKLYDLENDCPHIGSYLHHLNTCDDDNKFYEISKKIQENKNEPNNGSKNKESKSLNLLKEMDHAPVLLRRNSDDAISSRRIGGGQLSDRQKMRPRSLSISLDDSKRNQLTQSTLSPNDKISSDNPPIPSQMKITPRSVSMSFQDPVHSLDCTITFHKKDDPSFKDVYIEDWTVGQVGEWLDSLGAGEYKENFINQKISGFELVELLNVEFKALNEIGVHKVGDKLRILRNIRKEKEKQQNTVIETK